MLSHIIDNSTSNLHTAENTSLYFDQTTGFIYAAYIGNNLLPTIATAHISDLSNWLTTTIGTEPVLNDSHNGISLGLDPTGNLHIMWNMHNTSDFIYQRTTVPYDLSTLDWADVEVIVPPSRTAPVSQLSYPRFYRAGDSFYLTFRNGVPGNADQYLLTFDNQSQQWVNFPGLIISGELTTPLSSPYLGICRGTDDSSLHLVWTNRTSYYNRGLYYGRWDGQSFDSYQVVDTTHSLANTGLSMVVDESAIYLFYLMVSETGKPEVYCSTSTNLTDWTHSQVTNLSLPRLRGCPTGPMDGPYRPCDMELQGVWAGLAHAQAGSLLPSPLKLFYGRSIALPGPAWQRPAALLYESISHDNGLSWTTKEFPLPISQLTTEITINNNSQYLDFALCQDMEGNMRLLDFTDNIVAESELSISTIITPQTILPIKYAIHHDPIFYSRSNFTIDVTIRPNQSTSPMGLIDCGGLLGSRCFRLLLWGNGRPLVYSPSHLQILLGNDTGSSWSLIWNPQVGEIYPFTYTHLRVERSGDILNVLRLLDHEWTTVDSINISTITTPLSAINRTIIIGGVEDGNGKIIYLYSGHIEVEIR